MPKGGELMAEEFFLPKLGQTVEEVTLIKWLVEDGAKVSQGQELLEVETDKAVFPVEANAKGYIHIGPFKEGDVLPVLTVVAIIGKPEDKFVAGGTAAGKPAEAASSPTATAPEPAPAAVSAGPEGNQQPFASPRAKKMAAEKGVELAQVTPTGGDGARVTERDVVAFLKEAPKATPVAQKMAAESGVDLRGVAGTGPRGKIVKDDIARAPQPAVQSAPVAAFPSLPVADVTERIPLKGVRAIIAERMAASVHTTARVTLVSEVDASEFVAARMRIKELVEKEWGFAPGYNELMARIVAVALRRCPYMNARLAADAIEHLGHVNLGMAMDTDRGLVVPVIRDADQKNLRQFGTEFRTLVERARSGRSLPDDLTGGTFTITNLGHFGIDAFTPVINMPEAAILGMGRIAPKPAVVNNAVVIRSMVTISLVFDHRVNDGAPAARFLQVIAQLIEQPYLLLAA
jgi:pyruvate dehydrogenase E2 component (dihydrolipoamide acetyltransferase)